MSNIDLNVDVGQTKTLTFNTKDKYNSEDIVFNIAANDAIVERAKVADDLGGREETREEQFTYQATANDESIKDGLAIVKSIKGNTVVANQIFDYNFSQLDVDSGQYNYFHGKYEFPLNHKLLITFNYSNSNPNLTTILCGLSKYGSFWGGQIIVNVGIGDNLQLKCIITNLNATNITLFIREYNNLGVLTGFSVDTDSIKIVDLTQWFGESNEPATVEEFERLYPNLPTEYNEGSLLNLNADSIKSVGFNAFNGNYAQVLGGMQYYLGGNITSLTFKENLEDVGEVIEIPSDKLYTPNTNGYLVAEGSNICINLSHSGYRNGEYESYKESIVNLPIQAYFPDGMKSAGAVRDEIVWDEGLKKYKAIQRIGSLLLPDLSFISEASNNFAWGFYALIPESYDVYTEDSILWKANAITSLCPVDTTNAVVNQNKDAFCIYKYRNQIYILVKNNKYNYATDLEVFKQSLQGQILYYELAEPIETIIDDYDIIDYEVSDFGTEEILSNEPTTPIVADIQYGFNAVDEIRDHRFAINKLKKSINDGVLTITQGEEILGEFSANQESNTTIELSKVATSGSYEDLSDKPSLNYLPLSGGTMSGSIDMNKFSLKTAGFETVTALPTTNLFVGRKVVMNGIEYTYNGNLWTSQLDPLQKYYNNLDGIYYPLASLNANSYELQLQNHQISQIPQLLANNSTSLIDNVLQSNEYIHERMDNGTTEWVETTNRDLYLGDKLRFTAWKDWETNVRGLGFKYPGSINYIEIDINHRTDKMKVTIEYLTYTNTLGDADVNNSANYTWWKVYEKEFPNQQTTWIFPLQRIIYPNSIEGGTDGRWYISNVRITIESITAGSSERFTPYINIYTSNQIKPQTVPININYDAKIKPTQTTTTYKTNSWILQYLTQGVHWLRDNKVETNSDATLTSLNIKGTANSTATITADQSKNLYVSTDGNIPFVVFPTIVCPGINNSNQISLGVHNQYWKEVWAGKYKIPNGTSSQFLKADGSVDSSTYATLDSTGKVPTSQLPSYVDDVDEYTNRASFPATGEKGKIYVDTTLNDIYRWTGSTYIKISGIIGAQGEKGAQGYTGLQGATGLQGKQGFQGIKGTDGTRGVQGFQGIKGTDGTRGVQGFQGLQGTKGTTGLQGTTGSTGIQGKQGLQGIKGTDGTRGVQGFQGIKGTDGSNGTNGVQGYQGYQGIKGTDGTNGTNGAQGYQGYTGAQGYQGIKGTDGSRGVQGYQGYTGAQGYQGYQGYTGAQGATGLQGKQGLQGIKGTDGSRGVQGFQGIKGTDGTNGTNGAQGYTGLQGATGAQGKNGTNGTNGVQGYQGIKGTDGSRGVQGFQGYTGPKGEDGTSVKILGTKDSTSQLPSSGNVNGDGYIIGDNLYVWDGLTWTNVGTIKGPQGVQGYRGYQGFQGYTGLQGATGFQGIKGTDGTRGVQGYTGLQGATGLQGIKGTDGSRGVQGYTGLQGIKGTDGTNGTNGVQGYRGYQGLQGIKGTDGSNGTNGAQGYTGAQGYQGYQGLTGETGDNGTNFAGCFTSNYSLYDSNQITAGTVYTFNKANFNFLNIPLFQGDTILVIYTFEYNSVTYVEQYFIRLVRFRDDETTFTGVVLKWFKISDGEVGLQGATGAQGATGIQGYQGYQGKNGTNGTNGTNGVQGYRGYQGIQGISGALATNHWYLDKANPEVTGTNGGSKLIQLDTINDSIFAKLSDLTNGPLNGRSFIVDLADSDGSGMINNLFGDFSKYSVPNQVRYHFYIRNVSKRQGAVKINWNSEFYTNVPHIDGYAPQVVLNYGECCKIEFVKFDQTYSWVDVELEDIVYNTSTAAASENNEDNAMSQIMNYCDNNKLSYTLDKNSNNLSFNLIDIIADMCSKLK